MSIWCHKKITERACTRSPRQNNNNSGNGDGTIPFRLWVIYYEKISFEIYRKDPNSKWLHITDWICSSSYLIKCISFILKMKQTFIETQSGEQCGTIELRLFFCVYYFIDVRMVGWPSINLQLFCWKYVKLFSFVSYNFKWITRKCWQSVLS